MTNGVNPAVPAGQGGVQPPGGAMNPPPPSSAVGDPGWWSVALIVLFAGAILIAIASDLPALSRLADPAYARGLITWLMVVSAIGLAFILVYQAFNQKAADGDAPFRHAREVFTSLMGIVGTIVGFYFGSAEKGTAQLTLAEPLRDGTTISTTVAGGTPPYRFQVSSADKTILVVQDKLQQADSGWIKFSLAKVPTESSSVSITVFDSKDVKGTRSFDIKPDVKSEPKPDTKQGSKPVEPAPTPAKPAASGT